MYSIQIHTVLKKLLSFYYLMGFWYRGKVPTIKEKMLRMFYSIYLLSVLISLIIATATNENVDLAIFSCECGIADAVLCVKLWMFIWKQKQIQEILNQISVFSMQNYELFKDFENKLEKPMKFASICFRAFFVYTFLIGIGPFVGTERKFFVDFALPLDYKNNEIAFWIAYVYLTTVAALGIIITVSTSVVIGYLMFHCSLRYEVLGSELRIMGRIASNGKEGMTEKEKQRQFLRDLIASIDSYRHLRG